MTPSKIALLISYFLFCASSYAQLSWSPIGPSGGGWLTAITVIDDNANTVYVSCDVGGIYKSTNHGESWEMLVLA